MPVVPIEELRVCTNCEIHHYENCPSCFGFGVYNVKAADYRIYPMPAGAAHDGSFRTKDWEPCPFCHSTPYGPPGVGKHQERG